jgi:hypothetical protein
MGRGIAMLTLIETGVVGVSEGVLVEVSVGVEVGVPVEV